MKPTIQDDLDVSNFSTDFTNMPPTESPAVAPEMGNKLFKVGTAGMAVVRTTGVVTGQRGGGVAQLVECWV